MEVESVDKSKRSFTRSGRLYRWKHVIKLTGQSIDAVIYGVHTGLSDLGAYRHYVVFGMKQPASMFEARTKEVRERWYGGKVRDVRWTGGQLSKLLNRDVDLLRLQIQERETKIQVIPNERNGWVHIIVPFEIAPTSNSVKVYNRIAEHIRNYLGTRTAK